MAGRAPDKRRYLAVGAPHHPMTLGKIERFWKTLFTEFLSRVQFDSFEDAQRRLSLWIKYYNHRRPHQGIGGLCPADRFFEIAADLRKAVERGVEENVLEDALRGPPRKPFYMVGRLGEQSVVIRAEKGKIKMLVDGNENEEGKELTYDVNEEDDSVEVPADAGTPGVPGEGEVRSGAFGVDGAAQALGDLPGVGDPMAAAGELAAPEPGSDDGAAGAAAGERREDACTGQPSAAPAGEDRGAFEPSRQAAEALGEDPGGSDEERLRQELMEQITLLHQLLAEALFV